MSQERISLELDGTGGGYGKFAGITVRELSQNFATIAADGDMRAFSAVLRIAREQIEARGTLAAHRWVVAFFLTGAAICGVTIPFIPEGKAHDNVIKAAIGCLIFVVMFGAGVVRTMKATTSAIAQERAIRDLALDTLTQITNEPGFKPKPLNVDQKRILASLLKTGRRKEPQLESLLQDES